MSDAADELRALFAEWEVTRPPRCIPESWPARVAREHVDLMVECGDDPQMAERIMDGSIEAARALGHIDDDEADAALRWRDRRKHLGSSGRGGRGK